MEGFSYVDIFNTKGIEYILVIGFLVAFIFYWRFLDQPKQKKILVGARNTESSNDWFHLLKNRYYHPGHCWVLPEPNNIVKVGIDDFAQKLLGKPDALELPLVGSEIYQGEHGWKVQKDSKSIDILSPVRGKVIAINEDVLKSPELIEQDPYDAGWLLKVNVPKINSNLKNLFTGKLAVSWMENTVQELRERITGDLGLVMQDGGLPVSGFAQAMSPENWESIAAEFLLTK
jgi:glycine cleavage system H lipoate-binding protein